MYSGITLTWFLSAQGSYLLYSLSVIWPRCQVEGDGQMRALPRLRIYALFLTWRGGLPCLKLNLSWG